MPALPAAPPPVELRVEAADAQQRLDQFLVAKQPELTRSRLKQLIDAGDAKVNGAVAKPARKLKAGDVVTLLIPPPRPATPEAEDLPFGILFEDDQVVVVNKPPGLVVHPAATIHSGTLVNALLFRIKGLTGIGGEVRPGLVHRLDRDTSGCMVVAKTEGALTYLQAAFKRRDVEKRYSALVHGKPPAKGTFDTSYGRHAKDRKRFTSKLSEGKRALTHYTVAESLPGPVTLVDIKLETGRTHQIRVHFSDAGFPLVHDVMYGGVAREAKQKSDLLTEASAAIGRQALHARVLAFPHPKTAEVLRFEAPLPADFQAAIDRLRRG